MSFTYHLRAEWGHACVGRGFCRWKTTISRNGRGSASEAGLSRSEYGPLESNDEELLSATELVRKNQAGEDVEAKIRETLPAALPRRATLGKRHMYSTANGGSDARLKVPKRVISRLILDYG